MRTIEASCTRIVFSHLLVSHFHLSENPRTVEILHVACRGFSFRFASIAHSVVNELSTL